jgi:peptidyl-tRNA hydrolase
LQDLSTEEEPLLQEVLAHAAAAIEIWLQQGIETAMNQYNRGAET